MSNRGISNYQIENAVANVWDDDLTNNFVGVFPSNYMNKFIDHAAMMKEKGGKYPFIIGNTDAGSKQGTHWWSILDIEPKTDIFFFNSFGLYYSRRPKNNRKNIIWNREND